MSTTPTNIVRIAERRLRLVTDDEAQQLGLSEWNLRRRVDNGGLFRVLPGVLATHPGPYDVEQQALALCLSMPFAVLSHATAAAHWGLRRAPKDRFEVTVPKGTRIRNLHPVIHYSNRMSDHHVVDLVDGARVTSPARTVFDLGGVLDRPGHLSVIEDIRNKGLCSDDELGEVYHDLCGQGRRGSAAWQRIADSVERRARPTMSELEVEFQAALMAHGMPPAVQQHPVMLPNGRFVHLDLAYPDVRVDVEIDHAEWHSTQTAVERDKMRDLGLAVLGWERLRFTDRMIARRLVVCVSMVAAVIDLRRRGMGTPAA